MSAQTQHDNGAGAASASDLLLVIDSRTGKEYEIPIEDGTIRATGRTCIRTTTCPTRATSSRCSTR